MQPVGRHRERDGVGNQCAKVQCAACIAVQEDKSVGREMRGVVSCGDASLELEVVMMVVVVMID